MVQNHVQELQASLQLQNFSTNLNFCECLERLFWFFQIVDPNLSVARPCPGAFPPTHDTQDSAPCGGGGRLATANAAVRQCERRRCGVVLHGAAPAARGGGWVCCAREGRNCTATGEASAALLRRKEGHAHGQKRVRAAALAGPRRQDVDAAVLRHPPAPPTPQLTQSLAPHSRNLMHPGICQQPRTASPPSMICRRQRTRAGGRGGGAAGPLAWGLSSSTTASS